MVLERQRMTSTTLIAILVCISLVLLLVVTDFVTRSGAFDEWSRSPETGARVFLFYVAFWLIPSILMFGGVLLAATKG